MNQPDLGLKITELRQQFRQRGEKGHSSFGDRNSVGTQPSTPPRPPTLSSITTSVHSPRNSWMRTRVPTSKGPPASFGVGAFSPLLKNACVIVVLLLSTIAAFFFLFLPLFDRWLFDESSEADCIQPVPLTLGFFALITFTSAKSSSCLMTLTSEFAGRGASKVRCLGFGSLPRKLENISVGWLIMYSRMFGFFLPNNLFLKRSMGNKGPGS